MIVGTYGCVEGTVNQVLFDPNAGTLPVYSSEVGVALVLYTGFEIGINAVIMKDQVGQFSHDQLAQLKGKKIRVKGEVRSVSSGGVTFYIKGVVLGQPGQLQDLSNEP